MAESMSCEFLFRQQDFSTTDESRGHCKSHNQPDLA